MGTTADAVEPTPPAPPDPPAKQLILPGETFTVAGRTAFVFAADDKKTADGPRPWVLYCPTLPDYPDEAERWMHEQFTRAGVAVAGVDTGESYGSPAAVEATLALHRELVRRGYARRPAVLGRSRGGLGAAAWAIAHPELTAGVGGIYPVYDWRTYPGVDATAAAYGLTSEELLRRAPELCPVERAAVAARGGVPFFIIHGDDDRVVPLEPNSGRLKQQYADAGRSDLAKLVVAEGQGHNFWEGFFHCQPLVDFLIKRARAGAAAAE